MFSTQFNNFNSPKPFVGYVQDIYATFLTATKKELENVVKKLEEKSPEPMNSMLEKQPRAQAINKCRERKNMVPEDVPPTTPGINH